MSIYTETLPRAGCLAQLDEIIRDLPYAPRPGDTVALWEHKWADKEGRIIVDGIWHSRGQWGAQAIRWHCPERGNKGLFGRGLALYGMDLPSWAETLPRVK